MALGVCLFIFLSSGIIPWSLPMLTFSKEKDTSFCKMSLNLGLSIVGLLIRISCFWQNSPEVSGGTCHQFVPLG